MVQTQKSIIGSSPTDSTNGRRTGAERDGAHLISHEHRGYRLCYGVSIYLIWSSTARFTQMQKPGGFWLWIIGRFSLGDLMPYVRQNIFKNHEMASILVPLVSFKPGRSDPFAFLWSWKKCPKSLQFCHLGTQITYGFSYEDPIDRANERRQ